MTLLDNAPAEGSRPERRHQNRSGSLAEMETSTLRNGKARTSLDRSTSEPKLFTERRRSQQRSARFSIDYPSLDEADEVEMRGGTPVAKRTRASTGRATDASAESNEHTSESDADASDEEPVSAEPSVRVLRNGKIVLAEEPQSLPELEDETGSDAGNQSVEMESASDVEEEESGMVLSLRHGVLLISSQDPEEAEDSAVDLAVATEKTLLRLRRDELVQLCADRELPVDGTKKELSQALLDWVSPVRLFFDDELIATSSATRWTKRTLAFARARMVLAAVHPAHPLLRIPWLPSASIGVQTLQLRKRARRRRLKHLPE